MGAAADLFFVRDADADTLNKRVRPSDAQLGYLRENKDALEEHLRRDLSDRCGATVSTWLQGSYKLHTLIRPLHKQEYDVDLGVYVEWGDDQPEHLGALELRQHLQESLREFVADHDAARKLEEPPKERCCRVYFQKQLHIDAPGYHHHSESGVARLATLTKGWEYSDPEQMLRWFQEKLEGEERAQARRLTRYLKAWAVLKFSDAAGARPSSLMITVLCANAYADVISDRAVDDDDALREVVESIFWRLSEDRRVENPVESDQDGDINRMSDSGFDVFMRELAGLMGVARRGCEAESEADAAAIWSESFDYLLPLPDVAGFVEEDFARGLLVPAPEISISVSDTRGGAVTRRYEGQVDLVRVGEWMRFRITNVASLPVGAQIRWVVRNVGEHALEENDVGHSTLDAGNYWHDESAAYHGRHFMDCEIRVRNHIQSVTRVPVAVTNTRVPPRHPARRPNYTRIGRR